MMHGSMNVKCRIFGSHKGPNYFLITRELLTSQERLFKKELAECQGKK